MTFPFDMTFNNLTTIELITQANDPKTLSTMDQGDLRSMIQELASRLEDLFYADMHERREWIE